METWVPLCLRDSMIGNGGGKIYVGLKNDTVLLKYGTLIIRRKLSVSCP